MAYPGAIIENPVAGDRIIFRRTAAETDGELLEFDLHAVAGAQGPPEHIHPSAEERFEVLSGSIDAQINGQMRTFRAGETFVVPAGTPHTWWNSASSETQVRVQIRPASRMESFLETIYGLAKDEKTNSRGLPNPLQLAVFAQAYFDVNHVAQPPLAMQKFLFGLLAPVGRLLGYRADYPYPYPSEHQAEESTV